MTEEFYRTGSYSADHTTFGGKIWDSDYDGYNSMTDIASRIISDWKFDEQCKRDIENRNTYRKGK